jgi:hypothetical protein
MCCVVVVCEIFSIHYFATFNIKLCLLYFRWDDDVVFKNCAKGEEKKSAFINDTLRSEFHKKFMEKYIK